MVAFVGLCGGSGTSTLTFLTAAAAARDSTLPVLAIDAEGHNGGLAYYADAEGPYSLGDLVAMDVDPHVRHQIHDPMYAESAYGARIVARPPRGALPSLPASHLHAADVAQPGGPVYQSVSDLLGECRRSHGLTLIDCGTLARPEARAALDCATHIVWLLPATVSGSRRAKQLLDTVVPFLPGQEIVCARRDASERKAPTDDLRDIAAERVGPLVLMPHIPDLASHSLSDALDHAETALHALAGVLRR
jgi:cellulose biosynthesis protein BcsQ